MNLTPSSNPNPFPQPQTPRVNRLITMDMTLPICGPDGALCGPAREPIWSLAATFLISLVLAGVGLKIAASDDLFASSDAERKEALKVALQKHPLHRLLESKVGDCDSSCLRPL